MTFKMTCSCGDTMNVEAENRDEAVGKFKAMMDEGAIKTHMDEKHPGEPLISVADCHKMIEETTVAV
ncbi:MAG TPA: hypothetical protein VJC12_01735 [Candidatus Paceibacterota bacterium]